MYVIQFNGTYNEPNVVTDENRYFSWLCSVLKQNKSVEKNSKPQAIQSHSSYMCYSLSWYLCVRKEGHNMFAVAVTNAKEIILNPFFMC